MIIFADKLFVNPLFVIKAFNYSELIRAFEQIEQLKKEFFIVGYIRYEAFEKTEYKFPLLYFEVFKDYNIYKPKIFEKLPNSKQIVTKPLVNFTQYSDAIKKIKDEIALGNTYEVNYTYDFEVDYDGDELELFEYLLQKQKTPYNFFVKNEYDTILSFSPELFFSLKNNHIITKPMKGTINRGKTPKEDEKLIEFLKNDEKNRAENVMIVAK
jgi:para-aminobenzoate synthetase/4-amino-4-deoxychorismate lyase